jgi:hypothetical protein
MLPMEIVFFSVTLFLALVALMHWKRRRTLVRQRLSRGLKEYANRTAAGSNDSEEEEHGESLATVQ